MPDAATQMITSSGSGGAATPSLAPGTTSPNAAQPSLSPEVMAAIKSQPSQGGYMQKPATGVLDFFSRLGQLQSGMAAQKVQAEMEDRRHNAETMSAALQTNPALAASADFMKLYAQHTSPEMAQGMGLWAQAEQMKRAASAQQMQSAMADNGAPSNAPASPQDLNGLIQQQQQLQAAAQQHYKNLAAQASSDPDFAARAKPVLDALKSEMEDHSKRLGEYISQKYQTDRSTASNEAIAERQTKSEAATASRQQQSQAETEKLQGQRESEQNTRFLTAQKESEQRQLSAQEFSERMNRQHEDFRDHLENIKDARTDTQKKAAFLKTTASLAKQQTDLASRLNKGSDYDQHAREAEVQAHNQNIDSLKMLTDDPAQADALEKLKIGVAPAKPGAVFGSLWSTPGAVGATPEGAPAAVAAAPSAPIVSKSGKEMIPNPDKPGKFLYKD